MFIDAEPILTRSFAFGEPVAEPAGPPTLPGKPATSPRGDAAGLGQRPPATRIKPPGDMIKLEDRLHYLLQPPLETLLSRSVDWRCPFQPVPLPVRRRGVSLSAACGDPGRRDGPGQDHAGDHRHPPLAPSRRDPQRAVGLPQAAGDQLAARVRALGARSCRCWRSKAIRPGGAWQWQLSDVPRADRQLRDPGPRPGNPRPAWRRPPIALRPGGARRVAADQEPRQHHQRGRPRRIAAAELGLDRHARGKQRRRPGGHLRVPRPGLPFAAR